MIYRKMCQAWTRLEVTVMQVKNRNEVYYENATCKNQFRIINREPFIKKKGAMRQMRMRVQLNSSFIVDDGGQFQNVQQNCGKQSGRVQAISKQQD